MLALYRELDVVIGVDTHKTPTPGYRQLIAFGRRHDATLGAIEGTGSFGAGLTTALLGPDRLPERLWRLALGQLLDTCAGLRDSSATKRGGGRHRAGDAVRRTPGATAMWFTESQVDLCGERPRADRVRFPEHQSRRVHAS